MGIAKRRHPGGGSVTSALLELGLVRREQVDEAFEQARLGGGDSPQLILLRSGAVTGRALIVAVRHRWGLDPPPDPEPFPVAAGIGLEAVDGRIGLTT